MLGIHKLTFFVPKNWWQRFAWSIVHESSIFPAKGTKLLKEMARDPKYEFHLVTARFGFLKDNLYNWLDKNELRKVFKSININEGYAQPHEYKLQITRRLNLDYYVEDNLDIVVYLKDKVKTKIFWIYNFMDKRHNYPDKFPYLEEALKATRK